MWKKCDGALWVAFGDGGEEELPLTGTKTEM